MMRIVERLKMSRTVLLGMAVIVGIVIALLEVVLSREGGNLLFSLTFWTALAEGCVALVAAAELSCAKWIRPIRATLLSVYPVMFLTTFLFLILGLKIDIYPWVKDQNAWLNPRFFVLRNFLLLLITSLVGWKYAHESIRESDSRNRYAVFYVFLFITTQSLVAFDWVMTLERPWFSTLFGGYFFVEAFYMGIAIAALISLTRLHLHPEDAELRTSMRDSATLLFGFSLFWAGLFFAQYLVIWYGNLPEETSFIVSRLANPTLRWLYLLILLALFFIPFTSFLSQRAKTSIPIVRTLSILVLAGICMERFFFLIPVTSLNPMLLVIESVALGAVFLVSLLNQGELLPE